MNKLTFGKCLVLFFSVAALLAMSVAAYADTITIADTGSGTTTDLNYLVSYVGTTALTNPGVLPGTDSAGVIISPSLYPGSWNTSTGTGAWIGPTSANQTGNPLNATVGYYIYQVSFNIGANLPSTVVISGDFSSDNCMAVLGIDGTAVTAGTGQVLPTTACGGGNHAFEIGATSSLVSSAPAGTYWATAAFTTGTNYIEFEVQNAPGSTPNPTGLVTFDMTGSGSTGTTPEPSTAGLLIAGIAAVAWLRRRSLRPSA
jgi:hypothetical protein